VSFRTNLICAAVIASLAACGGGSGSNSSNSTNVASSVAASAAGAAASAVGGFANTVAAEIPAGLHCGAVPPVWVNTKTKAYHEPSDPLYGKTKSGEYMCASAAVAAGYHKASGHRWHHHGAGADAGGSMNSDTGSPAPAAT
jgi:hypothetical protein